jgi:hypothetical protein
MLYSGHKAISRIVKLLFWTLRLSANSLGGAYRYGHLRVISGCGQYINIVVCKVVMLDRFCAINYCEST